MKISDSEMEIMNIIWSIGGEVTSKEILEKLNTTWKKTTILTFLKRLSDKGILSTRCEKKTNYYSPCLTKDDYIHMQTEDFLKSTHKGSVKNFLASLYADKAPNDKELSDIKDWFSNL